ncbi:MAG TPA: arsinothricin resistance N-acetyltransferase ArsN1 family A [Candidatus Eremiobacteraceae bacterium]|nr:arsinothricin resistance N-acetyltransferase ArsN1 family A [Candidatus Eremiobacteraceae bacterium]
MPASRLTITTRTASMSDRPAITFIYNQGIEDRVATLDVDPKSEGEVATWLSIDQPTRYTVIVAESDSRIVGWASLRPYSHRCAYAGVAELSIYVERAARGKGVGEQLLAALEEHARLNAFHKIVLFALSSNEAGRRLYGKRGFREVGTFKEQGKLDGRFVDVQAFEKIIPPADS